MLKNRRRKRKLYTGPRVDGQAVFGIELRVPDLTRLAAKAARAAVAAYHHKVRVLAEARRRGYASLVHAGLQ